MITRIKALALTLICLVAFVVIGAQIVGAFHAWECTCIHSVCEECGDREAQEWSEFHAIAVAEYESEFDALFNSYETKRASNGRMLIRSGSSGRYSFAKKGV